MKSILKLGAIAIAASLAAVPVMAASAQHAKPHHAKSVHTKSVHAKSVHAQARHAAAQYRVAGKIERFNAKHRTLTINHRVYRLAPRLASSSFRPGQKVHIVYKKGFGHRIVEKISPVQA